MWEPWQEGCMAMPGWLPKASSSLPSQADFQKLTTTIAKYAAPFHIILN